MGPSVELFSSINAINSSVSKRNVGFFTSGKRPNLGGGVEVGGSRKVLQKTRLLRGFFFCTLPYKSKLWQNERQLLAGDWNGDAGACRRDEVCKSIRSCAPALQQLQQVSDFFLLNIPSLLATGPKLQTVECLVSGIR